jgi:hypothetical protein
MKRLNFTGLLLFSVVMFSCGVNPPENSEKKYFRDFISSYSEIDYEFKKDMKPEDLFKEKEKNVFFKKDDKILFVQEKWDNQESVDTEAVIVKTMEDGYVELCKDIYITAGKKDKLFYSFDSFTWFQFESKDNYMQTGSFSFINKEKNFKLVTSWAFVQCEDAVPYKKSFEKPLLLPEGGDLVMNSNDISLGLNLKKNILYLEKGKLFKAFFDVDSNIVSMDSDSNILNINFLTDTYLYKKGMVVAVSFDGSDWSPTIFSFKYKFDNRIEASPDASFLKFVMDAKIRYKGFDK